MSMFPQMAKILKPKRKGVAEIDHYTPDAFEIARNLFRGQRCSKIKVARLLVDGQLMMSDGDDEKRTNVEFVINAKGHVLVAGLGIGMVLKPVLANPLVKSVTVVELHQDVIDLVAPTFKHRKLSVFQADIFNWKPGKGTKYDCIYFDIWPAITTDNLPEMAKLHQRFKAYKAPGGWMNSWMRDYLRSQLRSEMRMRPIYI